ncbi:MAG: hypothetical protein ABJN75_00230 [Hoeflea sp.]|uniref:hypothetical protein n=1 Tax=Hoeflea sp. TaxID=1940281 RepID=UPI003297F201
MRHFECGAANGACSPPVAFEVDFGSRNRRQPEAGLDPSEMVFMALNTGFYRDMGVIAMMLEGLRDARKDEAEGALR